MQMIKRPSRQAMDEATDLGVTMARTERSLRPKLTEADKYPSYASFAEAHRLVLEQSTGFAAWDAKIMKLAEREASRASIGLDDRRSCDAFVRHFAMPLRCSFWYGWESAVGLKRSYEAEHAGVVSAEGLGVLHVAETARSTDRPGTDDRQWKGDSGNGLFDLDDRVFDSLSVRPEDIVQMLHPRPGV